jgi:molecular chaperone GrpE
LFKEQDELLEKKDKEIEELENSVKDLKTRLAYQLAENDNTVKRYRKQMEDGKQFAISKFAKDILEIRDNLALALEHIDLEKINSTEDIEMLKQ